MYYYIIIKLYIFLIPDNINSVIFVIYILLIFFVVGILPEKHCFQKVFFIYKLYILKNFKNFKKSRQYTYILTFFYIDCRDFARSIITNNIKNIHNYYLYTLS